jgi:hypothetical protein
MSVEVKDLGNCLRHEAIVDMSLSVTLFFTGISKTAPKIFKPQEATRQVPMY